MRRSAPHRDQRRARFLEVEAGRVQLEQVEFPLRHCVEDVVSILALSAREKGLRAKSTRWQLFSSAARVITFRQSCFATNL
jgi:hypothetical protein